MSKPDIHAAAFAARRQSHRLELRLARLPVYLKIQPRGHRARHLPPADIRPHVPCGWASR
jgi:hypothetical protein